MRWPFSQALYILKDLVIGSGYGLFRLIRWLKNRRIDSEEPGSQPGLIQLTVEGTTIEVRSEVLELLRSIEIRKHTHRVVEPLAHEGVRSLDFREARQVTVTVETDDLRSFEPPEDEVVPLLERQVEMVVSVASVSFTEGNKWRFSDGERTFYATIEDADFLDRIDKGEPFRKGDFLRCEMRVVQSGKGSSLHTDYQAIEVYEHIPTGTQLRLLGSDEPPTLRPG